MKTRRDSRLNDQRTDILSPPKEDSFQEYVPTDTEDDSSPSAAPAVQSAPNRPEPKIKIKKSTKHPAKRQKKSNNAFHIDHNAALECFEFLDSKGKGYVSQEDLMSTASMLEVHLDGDQIEEMISFALKSSTSKMIDLETFQKLMDELNTP